MLRGCVPLATGTCSSTNEDGTHFFLRVLSIILPSVESVVTLESAARYPSDAVAAAGPSSFVFRGSTSKSSAGVVTPSHRPFAGLAPIGTSNIVACYDPAGHLGIDGTSDEVNVPPVGTRTPSLHGCLSLPR